MNDKFDLNEALEQIKAGAKIDGKERDANPLKAGLVEKVGTYPYSSAYFFLDEHPNVIPCISDSVMLKVFATVEARR